MAAIIQNVLTNWHNPTYPNSIGNKIFRVGKEPEIQKCGPSCKVEGKIAQIRQNWEVFAQNSLNKSQPTYLP